MTLAERIEALTDEECLSLTGPWLVRANTRGFYPYLKSHPNEPVWVTYKTSEQAQFVAGQLNAAHVRERLRELMGRPATCG